MRKIADEMGGVATFPEKKFELLKNCFAAFQHSVPNSLLHEIKSLGEFRDAVSLAQTNWIHFRRCHCVLFEKSLHSNSVREPCQHQRSPEPPPGARIPAIRSRRRRSVCISKELYSGHRSENPEEVQRTHREDILALIYAGLPQKIFE